MLLLGSATPSLESYAAAKQGRIALLELRKRAGAQPMPDVAVVDLRAEFESGNRAIFSDALVQALSEPALPRREEHSLRQSSRQRGFADLPYLRNGPAVPALQHSALRAPRRRAPTLSLLRFSNADREGVSDVRL